VAEDDLPPPERHGKLIDWWHAAKLATKLLCKGLASIALLMP
jgi:hypothetical protein